MVHLAALLRWVTVMGGTGQYRPDCFYPRAPPSGAAAPGWEWQPICKRHCNRRSIWRGKRAMLLGTAWRTRGHRMRWIEMASFSGPRRGVVPGVNGGVGMRCTSMSVTDVSQQCIISLALVAMPMGGFADPCVVEKIDNGGSGPIATQSDPRTKQRTRQGSYRHKPKKNAGKTRPRLT